SGATGLQIYLPVRAGYTFAQVRGLVEGVGRLLVQAWPEKATVAWSIPDRAGKVFIDYAMNRSGANLASVYSPRPRKSAPVSTPLDWAELDEDLEPEDFRIDNVWERFGSRDRFAGVLTDPQSIDQALTTLGVPNTGPEVTSIDVADHQSNAAVIAAG